MVDMESYMAENEPVTPLGLMERTAGKWVEKAVKFFREKEK